MMQILKLLFTERLYPAWIAALIWFNMANGDVIAIQDGDHNWGGNTGHQISYNLNQAEFAEAGFTDPKQPDPDIAIESGPLIAVQAPVRVIGKIDHEFFRASFPFLLYLLKRPPPSV